MTRTRTLLILLTVLALLLGVAGAVVFTAFTSRDTWTKPEPTSASAPAGLSSFYKQNLTWSTCDSAQCAWAKVPIDYDQPDGATTRIRIKVFPAEGGKAKRSIFVNPGGPGGSAVDFASSMESQFGEDVLKKFDIVGVEFRGGRAQEIRHCRRRPPGRGCELPAEVLVGQGL